jgi:hypothetical protein
MVRIISYASGHRLPADADRAVMNQVVRYRSGIVLLDAQARVDLAVRNAGQLQERTRRLAGLIGLVTATALLLGLVAAWYAAQRGRHHREHNSPARFGFARRAHVAAIVFSNEGGRTGA